MADYFDTDFDFLAAPAVTFPSSVVSQPSTSAATSGVSKYNPNGLPRRLPNGRFMSKSQIELFERGVSVEEIMRLAIEEEEKKKADVKAGLIVDEGLPKKKKKKSYPKKKKPPADTSQVEATSTAASAPSTGPEGSNFVFVQPQATSDFIQPQQQQLQPTTTTTTAAPSCLQIVNGQPVIQARLERIQAPDGTVMTVAVLPADIQNLLRNGGISLNVQSIQARPAISSSPTMIVRPVAPASPVVRATPPPNVSSVDQRYAPIQPKTKQQRPLITPVVSKSQHLAPIAPAKPVAPAASTSLPAEKFTFRLSPNDEKTVAELTSQINRYQAIAKRTKSENATLAKLEEKRSAILHRAATDHFKSLTGATGTTMMTAGGVPTVQINGVHYAAVPSTMRVASAKPSAVERVQTQDLLGVTNNNSRPNSHGSNFSDMPILERAAPTPMLSPKVSVTLGESSRNEEPVYVKRCQRLKERLADDEECVTRPDCGTRFLDKTDVVKRLLPYHLYEEPNISDQLLEAVDSDFKSYIDRCKTKAQDLFRRFFKASDATAPFSSRLDNLIVSDLLMKDEKRRLEDERDTAIREPERYIENLKATTAFPEPAVIDLKLEPIPLEAQEPAIPSDIKVESSRDVDIEAAIIDQGAVESSVINDGVEVAAKESAYEALEKEEESVRSSTSEMDPGTAIQQSMIDTRLKGDQEEEAAPPRPRSPSRAPAPPPPPPPVQAPLPQQDDSQERIEARISVKVVIRKRRVVDNDERRASSPAEIYMAESSKDVRGKSLFSVQSDKDGEEGTLRVPPLKIRLRCNKEPKSIGWKRNRDGIRFLGLDPSDSDDADAGEEPVVLEPRPGPSAVAPPREEAGPSMRYRSPRLGIGDEDEDENSATTTSPGDSGHDEDDAGDLREDDEDVQIVGEYDGDPPSRSIDQESTPGPSNRADQETDQSDNRYRPIDSDRNEINRSDQADQPTSLKIPRLKLFRSSNFASTTTVTSWRRRVDADASTRQQCMDSADNEASEDDDNESI